MAKYRRQYLAASLFFLLLQTSYFWEKELGIFAMFSFLGMALAFLFFCGMLCWEALLVVRERGKDRQRLRFIGILLVMLSLTVWDPNGLVDYAKFEARTVLTAHAEGAADCSNTLVLRSDHTFIERIVCFGLSETRGTYFIKNDTLFFEDVKLGRHQTTYDAFAILSISQPTGQPNYGRLFRQKEDVNNERAGLVITFLDTTWMAP